MPRLADIRASLRSQLRRFPGVTLFSLSQQDQADIEEEFLTVESSLVEQTVDATADEVKMLIDGPWGGMRFAVTLGVKF
ncbi:MAG: hypothetical protein MZV63_43485 [Marinilabiliales bacterium]|nr:hypothetical protein [Marinilabiliales bacterium]